MWVFIFLLSLAICFIRWIFWTVFSKPYRALQFTLCVCVCVLCVLCHSIVSDSFTTPWIVACQVPLSVGFSSKNTVMGCHVLIQGIFPIQGSNPGHPNSGQILNHLRHQGHPFTSMSSAKIWMILVAISTQTNSSHSCSCHTGHIYVAIDQSVLRCMVYRC